MSTEQLPTDLTSAHLGHGDHHATLEALYNERHPDKPLWRATHLALHQALAAELGTPIPVSLSGHIEDHNALHEAYNTLKAYQA